MSPSAPAQAHRAAGPMSAARRPSLACVALAVALAIGFGARAHADDDCPPPVAPGTSPKAGETLPGVATNTIQLRLDIRDASGHPVLARVTIRGSDNGFYPGVRDSTLQSHWWSVGYCYPRPADVIHVPPGVTRLTVGRGFEWAAQIRDYDLVSDTTLQISLTRFCDMAAEGWWPGDVHVHTRHAPLEYDIRPETVRRIAEAEGLAVIELLDQGYQFTGAPHPLSDSTLVLHYSFEHRNQVYGHVVFPALREAVDDVCCLSPEPAWPTISELRQDVVPLKGPMIVLAHPHTTNDYFLDGPWPGAGLGRGLPLLAAQGQLDAMDVVSYSNDPDADWDEWYDVLNAGLSCGISAGTDAVLNWYTHPPVGGWRVYADIGKNRQLNLDDWTAALRAGKTFVTNHPLIPLSRFNGVAPGGTLEVPGDSVSLAVEVRAFEMFGLSRVAVVAEGHEVWAREFHGWPFTTQWDSTVTLRIPTPAWLAVRAFGNVGFPHAFLSPSEAHTNAVVVTHLGERIRRTRAARRWLDGLDRLEQFVALHGSWPQLWQRDTVMAQIARSRSELGRAFVHAPEPFALDQPEPGTVVAETFGWRRSIDLEDGDRVRYRLILAADSAFTEPSVHWADDTTLTHVELPAVPQFWWRVEAVDLGGNVRVADGTPRMAFNAALLAGVPPTTGAVVRRAWPNPSTGFVRLQGFATPPEILDLHGRIVAVPGRGLTSAADGWWWDGRREGRAVPAGVYWARTRDGARPLRLVRLR